MNPDSNGRRRRLPVRALEKSELETGRFAGAGNVFCPLPRTPYSVNRIGMRR